MKLETLNLAASAAPWRGTSTSSAPSTSASPQQRKEARSE